MPKPLKLKMPLAGGLKKALNDTLLDGEEVLVSLPGQPGQALVVTPGRIIILRAGLAGGAGFKQKVIAIPLDQVAAVECTCGLMSGKLQIEAKGVHAGTYAVEFVRPGSPTDGGHRHFVEAEKRIRQLLEQRGLEDAVRVTTTKEETQRPSATRGRRKVILVLAVAVLLIAFANALPTGENETRSPTDTEQAVVLETAPEPASESEQLEAIVRDILKGNNNRRVPYFRAVAIEPDDKAGWIVLADMNAANNVSIARIRGGIESKMFQVHKALYASGLDVRMVSIRAYFPFRDNYGNVADRMIYMTVLLIEEAERINWAWMTPDRMQGIWTVGAPHEFRR